MFSIVRKLLDLFHPAEGWRLAAILGGALLTAFVETVAVAAVIPFMAVVTQPDLALDQPVLAWLSDVLPSGDRTTFLTSLGCLVLAILVLGNVLTMLTLWLTNRFVWLKHDEISTRLLAHYMAQPYTWFLQRNTADLGKNLLMEAHEVVRGVMLPLLELVVRGVMAAFIVALLFVLDPVLAVAVTIVVGGSYTLLWWAVRRRQSRIGREQVEANTGRFRYSAEALAGIKDLRVLGREQKMIERFSRVSRRYGIVTSEFEVATRIPRYVMELVAFGSVILVILYLLRVQSPDAAIIPMVAAYAVGGYKLLPALQAVFAGLVTVRFHAASLHDLHRDLMEGRTDQEAALAQAGSSPFPFRRSLEMAGVTYTYPNADVPALRDIHLEIPRGAAVGLVGPTGSGKTTLVDLLLGLLVPAGEKVLVDGVAVDEETARSWRRNVGYVPQQIFLADQTIAENIALGLPLEEVDPDRVERAARTAQLHDFVTTLPQGYQTLVGERGVRLSGGQRQRIGIARALYDDPGFLVLDEGTSALDGETEGALTNAILEARRDRTVVWVAHRLSTVRACDVVHVLDAGRIVASGTHDALLAHDRLFQAMAGGPDPSGSRP